MHDSVCCTVSNDKEFHLCLFGAVIIYISQHISVCFVSDRLVGSTMSIFLQSCIVFAPSTVLLFFYWQIPGFGVCLLLSLDSHALQLTVLIHIHNSKSGFGVWLHVTVPQSHDLAFVL